jgi:hypothetical protein
VTLGLKSVSAIVVGGLLVAIGAWRGVLAPAHLASLSPTAYFLAGLVASLATGLVAAGWRPEVRSKTALAPRGIVEDVPAPGPRELPGALQRVLLVVGFASLALVAIGNHAAARIVAIPDELGAPSPSSYCMPAKPADAAEPEPPPPPPPPSDQPGCALVRRAFSLGYTKSLGDCAPKQAAPIAAKPTKEKIVEPCTRRQLDEPFLHYGYRRVAGAATSATSVSPVDAIGHRVDDVRAHLDYLGGLLADIRHAITGTPHAAHHLWISLPDPHPGSLRDYFTGAPRCSTRFASLPLWPRWNPDDASPAVEHVLGQLLFATRFGTTASCNDYVLHWDAPADACARLAADPTGFLADTGSLRAVRAVLDRRRRQLQLAELAQLLGRPAQPPPPPVSAVVSLSCFSVDPCSAPLRGAARPGEAGACDRDRAATGSTIQLDGDDVGVREIHVAAVRPTGDGPIDLYLQLAALLAGADPHPRVDGPSPADLDAPGFTLTRLDPLAAADPFAGARWPLTRPELVDIYPIERHLHAFIDSFRRRYLPQRGRL